MDKAKAVKNILEKLKIAPEEMVRKPKYHRISTDLPKNYLETVDELNVSPTPDVAESAYQASLRMKQKFPPEKNLPTGGKQAPEIAEKRKLEEQAIEQRDRLLKFKSKSPDELTATDVLPETGLVERASKAISAPQRKLMQFAAQKLGRTGNAEDSESSAQDIVEALAEKAGLPEDSTLANVAKALGVAGLEVFADPTAVLPVNKLAKGAKAVSSAVKPANLDKLKQILGRASRDRQMSALGQKIAKMPEAKSKASLEELNKSGIIRIKGR